MSYVNYCHSEYKKIFTHEYSISELPSEDEKRRFAQKKAIKDSSINAIRKFPDIEPSDIWKIGRVTVTKRAFHFCDACAKLVDASTADVQASR